MKRSILFVAVAFICSNSFALAVPSSSTPTITNPQVHEINSRLRAQWKLIQQGVKSGKFTQAQATSLRAGLKSIRQQETAFFKQNNNHELTAAQQTQLNQSLNQNSTVLGETPVN